MGEFMDAFNAELVESGELVETRGAGGAGAHPAVRLQDGVPFVTDGPYAETQEVLAGYWIVECESFDRATEIAARLANCPAPEHVASQRVRRRPADRRERRRARAVAGAVPGPTVEDLLRELAPQVLGALVRRYGHFDTAEDAVQEALLAAATQWPSDGVPDNPRGWLITVALAPADRPAAQRAGPAAPRGRRRPADARRRVARRPTADSGTGGRRRHADPAVPVLPPGAVPDVADRADPARGRRPDAPPRSPAPSWSPRRR